MVQCLGGGRARQGNAAWQPGLSIHLVEELLRGDREDALERGCVGGVGGSVPAMLSGLRFASTR